MNEVCAGRSVICALLEAHHVEQRVKFGVGERGENLADHEFGTAGLVEPVDHHADARGGPELRMWLREGHSGKIVRACSCRSWGSG